MVDSKILTRKVVYCGGLAVALGCIAAYAFRLNFGVPAAQHSAQASRQALPALPSGSDPFQNVDPQLAAGQQPAGASALELPAFAGKAADAARDTLDWNRYPGTLNDQVSVAMASRDGMMALDLAAKLKECGVTSGILAIEGGVGGDPKAGTAAQAVRAARLEEYQRQIAKCQTVSGDISQLRLELLNLAIDKHVFGAATQAFLDGSRDERVVRNVIDDGRRGDLSALFQMAINKPAVFGFDSDFQAAVRYALKVGSEDPTVGGRVKFYFEQAQVLAVPLANEKSPVFDFAGISVASRSNGVSIAQELVRNMVRPKLGSLIVN